MRERVSNEDVELSGGNHWRRSVYADPRCVRRPMVNAAASQRASGFAKTPWAAESPRFQAGGSQMRGSQAVRAAPARQRLKLEAFFLHRDPFEPLMSET